MRANRPQPLLESLFVKRSSIYARESIVPPFITAGDRNRFESGSACRYPARAGKATRSTRKSVQRDSLKGA
jgi:hypothetical protein